MNSLSMICFEHQMDMMEIERNYMRNIINLEYKAGVLNENTEVIYEGVFETIKNAVLTIIEKIKNLFTAVIDLIRKGDDIKKDNDIKEEIKKVSENINSKKEITRSGERKGVLALPLKNDDTQNSQDDREKRRQERLDANRQRNADRNSKDNGVIQQDGMFELKLYKNIRLPFKEGRPLYVTIVNSNLYDYITKICSQIKSYTTFIGGVDSTSSERSQKRANRYMDFYEDDKKEVDGMTFDNRLAFANSVYKEYVGTIQVSKDYTPISKDNKTLDFPEETKKSIFNGLNETRTVKVKFSQLKDMAKDDIDFSNDLLQKCSTKNIEDDMKKSREEISKLSNEVKKINSNEMVLNDFKTLHVLVNLLSHCLTMIIPVHRSVIKTAKNNILYNLKTLNSYL